MGFRNILLWVIVIAAVVVVPVVLFLTLGRKNPKNNPGEAPEEK